MFRKSYADEQLDSELQAHIDLLAEENIRRGMSPKEARYLPARRATRVDPMVFLRNE